MRFTVRLPDEYEEKVAIVAKRMGLKKSDIARLALKQFPRGKLSWKQGNPFSKGETLVGKR